MGDLLNIGHTVVVVVSGCGWLNILDLHNDTDIETMDVEIKYEASFHKTHIPSSFVCFQTYSHPEDPRQREGCHHWRH